MSGICTGCGRGASPFYEEFDFPGAFPRIYRSYYDESEADPEEARVLIGQEHLDYQSSAYDTQDEHSQVDLNEKYEINSFIDDDEIASDSESDTSNNGSEVDYKAELEELQKKHADLRADHFDLLHEYSRFRYDMLGTSEEEDEDQDDDEEGVLIDGVGAHVVVACGGHLVADVVVSSFRAEEKDGKCGDARLGKPEDEEEERGDGDSICESEDEKKLDGTTMVARSTRFSAMGRESVEL
ncbi:hypothetical protein DSL72_004044 [Monilinia vaccinii-corymbosi]|uniref:Uncharacterized protein n=1 Tax=Monilinia vaccinii-corymbosi TaxID=61207 RepID=A0A8A3NZH4_9HELO|nr:hypothetical protein DSL72_004044 [Monilinia vaccinii-corymbosi]